MGRVARWCGVLALCGMGVAGLACGAAGGGGPAPAAGFGVLSGQTALVLPAQYARPVPGGWAGGAANARESARRLDAEIAFALAEQGGRVSWVLPEQQARVLRRRPGLEVDPYTLSADEARRQGGSLRSVRDPLYGELRTLAALFGARYAVLPLEILSEPAEEDGGEDVVDRLALRLLLLDARAGTVLWNGLVTGDDQAPASAGALATLAQRLAALVSP